MLSKLTLIALMRTPGFGRKRLLELLKGRDLFPAEPPKPSGKALEAAARSLKLCAASGIRVLVHGRAGFPRVLETIPDPPAILFVQGDPRALSWTRRTAVVGTRKPSAAGAETARRYASWLAAHGHAVVSGLALGIDAAAHEAALAGRGRTIAVLPSGILRVYPPQHRDLALRIARRGCLISEYPPEEAPEPYRFIERDRLQSGLSQGTIVVESDRRGGAMHTARFCLAQGRALGVCSSVDASGNRELLRHRAARPLDDLAGLSAWCRAARKLEPRPLGGALKR